MRLLIGGIELTDTDLICLENDLLDVEEWVRDAVRGKVANCRRRFLAEWRQRLAADPGVTSAPTNEAALILMVTRRSDYRNRQARERVS